VQTILDQVPPPPTANALRMRERKAEAEKEEFIADAESSRSQEEFEGTRYDAFTLSIYLPFLIIILICRR
jgi:hypothetical protein